MFKLLGQKNFFTYWLSNLVNVIGDHITMLAFPWIALQLTGNVAITAYVLAIQGVPRAVLMLLGGGLIDRTNPIFVILMTNIFRGLLVAGFAVMIYLDQVEIIHVFIVAGLFGIADSFYYPASVAAVPSLLKGDDRQGGNALIQVTNQLAVFLGPMVAGLVIAGQIDTSHADPAARLDAYAEDRIGLARAFAVDTFTFIVASITLAFVKLRQLDDNGEEQDEKSVIEQIKDGIKFVWSIPAMRLCFIGIGLLEFFYHAPIFVGLPALTKERYTEGALIVGWMIAAYGVGGLIGGILGGITPTPKPHNIAKMLFIFFAWSSASVGLVAIYDSYILAMIFFFSGGLLDNYIWIHFMTWLQKATPQKMMGRVMSLLMFMAIGMLPIAFVVMGKLFELYLEETMIFSGFSMVIFCAFAAFHPDGKRVEPQK